MTYLSPGEPQQLDGNKNKGAKSARGKSNAPTSPKQDIWVSGAADAGSQRPLGKGKNGPTQRTVEVQTWRRSFRLKKALREKIKTGVATQTVAKKKGHPAGCICSTNRGLHRSGQKDKQNEGRCQKKLLREAKRNFQRSSRSSGDLRQRHTGVSHVPGLVDGLGPRWAIKTQTGKRKIPQAGGGEPSGAEDKRRTGCVPKSP